MQGFYSDMPFNCNITSYKIDAVIDEKGHNWTTRNWTDLFTIDNDGNFTILNTTTCYNHLMVYITASTNLVTTHSVYTLNVTIYPFFSTNTNTAPIFRRVSGLKLPPKVLYIDHNYFDSNYTLP